MKENEPNDGGKYKDEDEEDHTVPGSNEEDPLPYVARKSKRVIKNVASSDGDIWREHLIVIQVPVESRRKKASKDNNSTDTEELTLRSFFQSEQTGQRAWDEPPSGASCIVYASDEAKQMAMLQMADIQILPTPANESEFKAPPDEGEDSRVNKGSRPSLMKRFTGLIGKKKEDLTNTSILAYKQGSYTDSFFQVNRSPLLEENDIEFALAMSLKNQDDVEKEEREAIALAKALSLSETENDDVILRQVLERSKDDVDYLITRSDEDLIAYGESYGLKSDRSEDVHNRFC